MNRKLALSCLFAFAASDVVAAAEKSAPPPGTSIDIVVGLSKRAAAKLAVAHEAIGVSASFFGEPRSDGSRSAAEDGQIAFGTVEKQLPRAGRVRIVPPAFDPARLALVARGKPRVNVNIFSARKTLPDNVLDCAFFEDSLEAALRQPILLRCKLIGEGMPKKKPGR